MQSEIRTEAKQPPLILDTLRLVKLYIDQLFALHLF